MKLAVYQGPSPAGRIDHALGKVAEVLAAARAAGAGAALLPELFLPGYNHPQVAALAQPLGGDWHRRLAALASEAEVALIAGFAEADEGRIYNAALALGPDGATLAHYRKVQLYGPREQAIFTPGDSFPTFRLGGRHAAMMVCYDVEFSGHVAHLVARGVDLILVPTANMEPFDHVSRVVVPAHAVNHAVTIAYANYCGQEGNLTYCGGSIIAGPDGAPIVEAGRGEAILIADLDAEIEADRLATQRADYRPVARTEE
jgi:5-aminopentanamidase